MKKAVISKLLLSALVAPSLAGFVVPYRDDIPVTNRLDGTAPDRFVPEGDALLYFESRPTQVLHCQDYIAGNTIKVDAASGEAEFFGADGGLCDSGGEYSDDLRSRTVRVKSGTLDRYDEYACQTNEAGKPRFSCFDMRFESVDELRHDAYVGPEVNSYLRVATSQQIKITDYFPQLADSYVNHETCYEYVSDADGVQHAVLFASSWSSGFFAVWIYKDPSGCDYGNEENTMYICYEDLETDRVTTCRQYAKDNGGQFRESSLTNGAATRTMSLVGTILAVVANVT